MGAVWDATKPPQGGSLQSLPMRDNFVAIGEAALLNASAQAQATPDLTMLVLAFQYVTSAGVRASYAGGTSPALTAPTTNPRIALLYFILTSGTLAWSYGAEAASPSPPTIPLDALPLVEVFCRVGMTAIVNVDDSANGYLLRHAPRLVALRNPLTTLGDLLVAVAAGAQSRLGIGSAGQVLSVVSGAPAWANLSIPPTYLPIAGANLPAGGAANVPPEIARESSTGTQVSTNPKSTTTVAKFDQATQESLVWDIDAPPVTPSGANLRLKWRTTVATGAVVWTASMVFTADGGVDTTVIFPNAQSVTTTVPGTAGAIVESVLVLGAAHMSNIAPNRLGRVNVVRWAGVAGDTCAADAVLVWARIDWLP